MDNNKTANLWKPVWELRSGSPTLFLSLVLKFLQACHLRQLITFQEVFVPLRQVATQIQFLRRKLWSFRVIYYLCGNLGQIPAGKTCFNVTQWGLAKWAHSCFSVFVPQEEQQRKNYTSDISYTLNLPQIQNSPVLGYTTNTGKARRCRNINLGDSRKIWLVAEFPCESGGTKDIKWKAKIGLFQHHFGIRAPCFVSQSSNNNNKDIYFW